jgi:glycerate 2-kinase
VRVVVAPDKFKGTLSARHVADAMASGVRSVFPDAVVDVLPMADGGDGTIDALLAAKGGRLESFDVTGPLGSNVEAPVAFLNDGSCVVEMASASGLVLVPEQERNARAATSRGTGELIKCALDRSNEGAVILVGIGGSASTDGGAGAATAVGWRFLDRHGKELPQGGEHLTSLHRIDPDSVFASVTSHAVVGISDVDNPLLGERGAARVFAPQKGATPRDVEVLEEALGTLSSRIEMDLGIDVRAVNSAGACGGMGAGILAFFSGRLAPGFETIQSITGLRDLIAGADLVVTGEGRLDEQSLGGKAPIGVARIAAGAGVPCIAVAGEIALDEEALQDCGLRAALDLMGAVGARRAYEDTSSAVSDATERLVSKVAPSL